MSVCTKEAPDCTLSQSGGGDPQEVENVQLDGDEAHVEQENGQD